MNEARIDIEVNGEPRRVPDGLSVAGLLERLDVDRRTVVVEVNRRVVRRADLDDVRVDAGDRVEIVRFVGGG
ncbi:MAG: sulfur carrier protein ThiS [Candidatus Palauibacterales bacterium]|nr:sulfur carrier protein ThiS [Candidatus Palauibacterales bacterium]MDP2528241.1 sulfur carrier protein ThiS [Candidatus Palauibacterales bacterium]MDP2584901.1 sulfur carrier protein ThiS [Candidatus Palauibacterales bacterium]